MIKKASEKLKILSAITFFSVSALFLGLAAPDKTATADSNLTPTVVNYDGKDYAGYHLISGNVGDFSSKVDLSETDLETPIFQFIVTPSVRGNGSVYSPDFEELTFSLTDAAGKSLTITFVPRKADSPKYYYMNCMAKGDNQTLLGEHQGNYQWALDPSDGAYLTDVYSAISPYTFDGYGADYSWFKFYDKNGNTFSSGCHGVVSIYYSAEENALYSDTGFQWKDDDPSNPLTLTDKFTLSKSGERRYRIRDFDKNDYRKGNNVISTVWTGFENPSDVNFTVNFSKLVTDKPSILLVTLGGKSIVDNYYVENHTKGVKNVAFPVPKPLFFSGIDYYDFVAAGGKVRIVDPEGEIAVAETNYSNGMSFVPQKSGYYSVYYSIRDPKSDETRINKFSFETLESGGTRLIMNGNDRDYLINETIDAGCAVYNEVQDYLPKVSLKISRNGSQVYNTDDLGELSYKFENKGDYTFLYSSTDLLGRTTEVIKNYSVTEYCLKIGQGLTETVFTDDASNLTKPDDSDFTIVNVLTGDTVAPTQTVITISKNGGAFETYNADILSGDGNYTVKYVYDFSDGSLETQRKFTVFKELPKITVSQIPTNTFFADGGNTEDDGVKLIALKGSVVSVPQGFFDCSLPVTVTVYKRDGGQTDCTDAYNAGNLSVTLDEAKVYCISAKAEAENGFTVVKTLFIDVKDGYINISPVENCAADIGREITLVAPVAKDIYGNAVSGGTFSVEFNGETVKVENGRFTPTALGIYKVKYSVTLSDYTETYEYDYRIFDDEKPEISLEKVKKTSFTGKFVKLRGYNVSDNSGGALDVNVSVSLNGKDVAVYNGGFFAEEAGEYEVRITATDMSGNQAEAVYKIVAGGKFIVFVLMMIIAGAVVLAASVATSIYLVKKNKKNKK